MSEDLGRTQEIIRLYNEDGMAMEEIGKRFQISRQRVHQILSRNPEEWEAHYNRRRQTKLQIERKDLYNRVVAGELKLSEAATEIGCTTEGLRAYFKTKGWLLPKTESPLHGTPYRYSRGCHCEECREAIREYHKRLIGREPPRHGYSGYTNYRCRCEICSAAAREVNARTWVRRKARDAALRSPA